MIFWNLQIKQKIPEAKASGNLLEVTTRFELVDEGFADPCLTTWPRHHIGSGTSTPLERPTRLELATSTLARWRSTS